MVKIGDFGISKVLSNTGELAKTAIGTPYYLSPEICREQRYNNKSDVWSLGCILYEMTAMKRPFEGSDIRQLVMRILRGAVPPIPRGYRCHRSSRLRLCTDPVIVAHTASSSSSSAHACVPMPMSLYFWPNVYASAGGLMCCYTL